MIGDGAADGVSNAVGGCGVMPDSGGNIGGGGAWPAEASGFAAAGFAAVFSGSSNGTV